MNRRLVLVAVELCLAWSVVLTGLAAIGNSWVLDRVSGGFYAVSVMPGWLRLVYGVMALLCVVVMWLEFRFYARTATVGQRRIGRLVVVLFLVSTLVNALSQSPPERWNALPAAVVMLGTAWLLRVRRPA